MSINSHIILGVRVDSGSQDDYLSIIKQAFQNKNGETCNIFTPNPEMLVAASTDEYYQDVLNHGTLNLCDGSGIVFLSKLFNPSSTAVQRVTGTDFMDNICSFAEQYGKSIYFLGSGNKEIVDKTAAYFKKIYPNLLVAGIHPGIDICINTIKNTEEISKKRVLIYDETQHDELIHDIILRAPDILFVAFGHEKQEKWIDEHVRHLPSIRVAMGVGGAFDFYGGKLLRAPKIMRDSGIEWLWRLFLQPKRLKRIITAVLIFPILFIRDHFRN